MNKSRVTDVDNVLATLEKLQKHLDNRRAALQKELSNHPEGKLYIKKAGGGYRCYSRTEGIERSCSRKARSTVDLARKKIAENDLRRIEACSGILQTAIHDMIKQGRTADTRSVQRVLDLFAGERVHLSRSECRWIDGAAPKMDYHSDGLIYRTDSGLYVRSKSERIIANCLDEYGILYRYEAPFFTDCGEFYPDFTIRRFFGQIVLWEHFGLMDDPGYFEKAMNKIEAYRREGFAQHTNLICTYEEDMKSEDTIRVIIEERLMG